VLFAAGPRRYPGEEVIPSNIKEPEFDTPLEEAGRSWKKLEEAGRRRIRRCFNVFSSRAQLPPFFAPDGGALLEVHRLTRAAKDGPDAVSADE
jgi:hypothetical protein